VIDASVVVIAQLVGGAIVTGDFGDLTYLVQAGGTSRSTRS